MTSRHGMGIESGGEERFRRRREREIRDTLLQGNRRRLERAGTVAALLLRLAILVRARRKARRSSQELWYIRA